MQLNEKMSINRKGPNMGDTSQGQRGLEHNKQSYLENNVNFSGAFVQYDVRFCTHSCCEEKEGENVL